MLYAMKGKDPSPEECSELDAWQIRTQAVNVPQLDDSRCVVYLSK